MLGFFGRLVIVWKDDKIYLRTQSTRLTLTYLLYEAKSGESEKNLQR